jgi:hypothetical protein
MKANKDKKENPFVVAQMAHPENQREDDRRKEACQGFTYVSTVGWICRREGIRRKDSEWQKQVKAFDPAPER